MDLFAVKSVPSIRVKYPQAFLDGLEIEVAGPAHPATLKADRERDDAIGAAGRGFTGDARRRVQNEYLAKRILSWNARGGGQDIALTVENAVKILESPELATVRSGLWEAIGDDDQNYKSN